MQRKGRHLKIIFTLFCTSLILPIYYFASVVTEGVFLRKFIKEIISEKSSIEYFNFIGLEGVINEKFSNKNYIIYIYANNSKGISEISRNKAQRPTVENTEIYNTYGTAQNEETQDIYNFESKLMNISERNHTIRLYQDFSIKYKQYQQKGDYQMRGDNITLNTLKNSIYSDSPVIMQGENSLLIGGNFLFINNTVTMNGDIFVDSPSIIITSNKLTANLDGQGSFVKNSELQFNEAKFEGNVKMFDKINNANVYAQKVTINYKKNLAILEGNAKIERPNNIVTGSILTYDLNRGIANLKSNEKTRVKLLITY